MRGRGWESLGVPAEYTATLLVQARVGVCRQGRHCLRAITTARIQDAVYWTKQYRRPKRKCSSFARITPRAELQFLAELETFIICTKCLRLWIECNKLNHKFYGIEGQYTIEVDRERQVLVLTIPEIFGST